MLFSGDVLAVGCPDTVLVDKLGAWIDGSLLYEGDAGNILCGVIRFRSDAELGLELPT